MMQIGPNFNVSEFENYGTINPFLSQAQKDQVIQTTNRVNSQLDWLGQLLGWGGDNYWNSLVSNVSQKRQLQGGSFGFYNGFVYPEIVEIRNWENSVVVKADSRFIAEQVFLLGDYTYKPSSMKQDGENYIFSFDSLSDQFYSDIANNKQLKVISKQEQPAPFARPTPGTSGDASFLCEQRGSSLVLYPSYDTPKSLPYVCNTFILGSRYYFDKPVELVVNPSLTLTSKYDFVTESWYIQLPSSLDSLGLGLTATLSYDESTLKVSLAPWKDPSDWGTQNKIENFTGVWGNKGGILPYNFVFDALSIHGYDEEKSVRLETIERFVGFDDLLNFVYYKKADISVSAPPLTKHSQVWWDPLNENFSIHVGDPLNCGPWVEIDYPSALSDSNSVDYTFPNAASFRSGEQSIPVGNVVRVSNIAGLGPSDKITGLNLTLSGPGEVELYKTEKSPYWVVRQFSLESEEDFSLNSENLPCTVVVNLRNSAGLSPEGSTYRVENLGFTVDGDYPIMLTKNVIKGSWHIAPPSNIKYVGNTRLFSSSLDYDNPVEGEIVWDFYNENLDTRSAQVFQYNSWVYNTSLGSWELVGDWVSINSSAPTGTVPEVIDFGVVKIYCEGKLMTPGSSYRTENFQFSYTIIPGSGLFNFLYTPITYKGSTKFPKITISDSITSAFTHDITNLIFSGISYYMSPNVLDSETLLRVWKSETLHAVDSLSDLELLRNSNVLVADANTGPGSDNWERYFLRLPPTYERNGSTWQKVNLVCQDFGYWGSSILPESMKCPSEGTKPRIYEEVFLQRGQIDSQALLYSEPYLYSATISDFGNSEDSDDYNNSGVLPGYDFPYDDFSEAETLDYDPLHNRRIAHVSEQEEGYGEWGGSYYRAVPCSDLSGFLVNDLISTTIEPLQPPIWDSSMYKLPPICAKGKASSTVDSNHYKVGYAFFSADLSAAEDSFFDFNN